MYKVCKFGAPWCGKCKVQDMEFVKNPLKCPLETFDVDKLEDSKVDELNIRNLPVTILYKYNEGNWEIINRWNAFVKSDEINSLING